MKTTIDISTPLFKKAQSLARKQRTTFKALVEAGLKVVLSAPYQGADAIVIEPYIFVAEGTANKSWDEVSEILLEDEVARFKR